MSANTTTTDNPIYSDYVSRNSLSVSPQLCEFIETEVLADLPIDADTFWQNFSELLSEFSPRNKALLLTRENMQAAIDQWHLKQINTKDKATDAEQITFLREIGYIAADVEDFTITTDHADDAIACIPGPQLVVPVRTHATH